MMKCYTGTLCPQVKWTIVQQATDFFSVVLKIKNDYKPKIFQQFEIF